MRVTVSAGAFLTAWQFVTPRVSQTPYLRTSVPVAQYAGFVGKVSIYIDGDESQGKIDGDKPQGNIDGDKPQGKSEARPEEMTTASTAGIIAIVGYRVFLGNEQWRVRWAGEAAADEMETTTWERWAVIDTETLRHEAARMRTQALQPSSVEAMKTASDVAAASKASTEAERIAQAWVAAEEEASVEVEAGAGDIASLIDYRVFLGNEQWRVRWAGGSADDEMDTWERWIVLDTDALRREAELLRTQATQPPEAVAEARAVAVKAAAMRDAAKRAHAKSAAEKAAAETAEAETAAAELAAADQAALELTLKQVRRQIRRTARLPAAKRKQQLRALQLEWHPDKQQDDEVGRWMATEVASMINAAMGTAKENMKARAELDAGGVVIPTGSADGGVAAKGDGGDGDGALRRLGYWWGSRAARLRK